MTVSSAAPARLTPVAVAQQALLHLLTPLESEQVPLEEAGGRFAASDVRSALDLPGFDNSAMDGYAVSATDVATASVAQPVRLRVAGEAVAGVVPTSRADHTAMRIFTGAPLPGGADSVVRQEDTERDGDDVLIYGSVQRGTDLRHRGEDVRIGDVILKAGTRLTSIDIAAVAAGGHATVSVSRRPSIALIATGDELVVPGGPMDDAKVVDSNTPMLCAAVREAGGEPHPFGIVADTHESVRKALEAAAMCDLIVCSAGVSVGDHDHVREVVAELGDIVTWGVAMRPGKPLVVGRVRGTPFIGLPGNPVSSSVTFELFARPAILRLQGATSPHRARFRARLAESMRKPAGLETYTRAVLRQQDADLPMAVSSGGQGSHMLSSLTAADALLVLPAELEMIPAGAVVDAIALR